MIDIKRKQKQLIKKLFYTILNKIKTEGYILFNKIDFEIRQEGFTNSQYTYYNDLDKPVRHKIIIRIKSLNDRIKNGYTNDYYQNRQKYVNPYILHNRHNAIRFVILHELGHSIAHDKKLYQKIEDKEIEERKADMFALKHLKMKEV